MVRVQNVIKIKHRGKVLSETTVNIDVEDREVIDKPVSTNITHTDKDGKGLININHQAIVVGERVAQIKRSTTAKVTADGQVLVRQFKSEISSRGEDVYFYDNAVGEFKGTLADAQRLFTNVDFSGLKIPDPVDRNHPELKNIELVSEDEFIKWKQQGHYDAEKNGGKPTTWGAWADNIQTGLDIAGLIPGVGEIADCVNGCISLARGNYGDAALSFAAMVPFAGAAATAGKLAKKVKKAIEKAEDLKTAKEGVYDLVIKNADDLQAYVGQAQDVVKRFKQHQRKNGVINMAQDIPYGQIHKMAGSTKVEREIYEQFIILEKYGGDIATLAKRNEDVFTQLLNKVNPVGGRYDLKTPQGIKEFKNKALEVAKKYELPITFPPTF